MARSKTTWVKGMDSPCPGGRPRSNADIMALARTLSKDAILTLAEIMNDPEAKESCRIAAATALLDRGYGKPQHDMDFKPIEELSPQDMTSEQIISVLSSIANNTLPLNLLTKQTDNEDVNKH